MAIAYEGSDTWDIGNNTTATLDVTIPANTDCVLLMWAGWRNGSWSMSTVTLESVSPDDAISQRAGTASYLTTGCCGWYGSSITTGANQTFSVTFSAAPAEGAVAVAFYYSGVNGAGWKSATHDSDPGSTVPSFSVSTASTDLVVAQDTRTDFSATPGNQTSPNTWTSREAFHGGDNEGARGRELAGTGGNVTVTSQNAYYSALTAVVLEEASSGQTGVLGQASETDSALAISGTKTLELGLPSETDSALSLTAVKTLSLGIAAEVDAALGLTGSKSRTLGLGTEADSALAITGVKARTLGQGTETDSALALTFGKSAVLGQAVETDSALSLIAVKSLTLGQGTETDSALALVIAGTVVLGQATETDSALALTKRKARELGLATEANSALALTPVKSRVLGLGEETDAALGLGAAKSRTLGIGAETDEALRLVMPQVLTLGMATEVSTALALIPPPPSRLWVEQDGVTASWTENGAVAHSWTEEESL